MKAHVSPTHKTTSSDFQIGNGKIKDSEVNAGGHFSNVIPICYSHSKIFVICNDIYKSADTAPSKTNRKYSSQSAESYRKRVNEILNATYHNRP